MPTTHTGSLPRPRDLLELLPRRHHEPAVFQTRVRDLVAAVVRRQRAIGLDIVNDGEQGKVDYSTYVAERLTGFEGEGAATSPGADLKDFPAFAARRRLPAYEPRPACSGPIGWKDFGAVERDIAHMVAAMRANGVTHAFMTAVSPGQAARFLVNGYYPSHEAYVQALADVLKREYAAIVDAGLILQIDCPDLASGRNTQFQDLSVEEFRAVATMHVEALNAAVANLPPERMRLHVCWGNYAGPHHRDVPLGDIIDILLRARPAGLSVEAANPRHAHEWTVFERVKLPDGKVIIPGVIDSTTNFIEHPDLVAQRLRQYAQLVGRERVIAGVDCGFATFAVDPVVDPDIAWAKLRTLVDGARRA
jgi:5-methyltetrahydropteroyltriglutamate--homocysteine methyltransferase